jgi:hypothetical protein
MSADNGVYIASFPEGYRITGEVGAIDNIDFFPSGSKKRKKELKIYFGKSEIFLDLNEALEQALKVAKDYDYLEYGVVYLGEYESFT